MQKTLSSALLLLMSVILCLGCPQRKRLSGHLGLKKADKKSAIAKVKASYRSISHYKAVYRGYLKDENSEKSRAAILYYRSPNNMRLELPANKTVLTFNGIYLTVLDTAKGLAREFDLSLVSALLAEMLKQYGAIFTSLLDAKSKSSYLSINPSDLRLLPYLEFVRKRGKLSFKFTFLLDSSSPPWARRLLRSGEAMAEESRRNYVFSYPEKKMIIDKEWGLVRQVQWRDDFNEVVAKIELATFDGKHHPKKSLFTITASKGIKVVKDRLPSKRYLELLWKLERRILNELIALEMEVWPRLSTAKRLKAQEKITIYYTKMFDLLMAPKITHATALMGGKASCGGILAMINNTALRKTKQKMMGGKAIGEKTISRGIVKDIAKVFMKKLSRVFLRGTNRSIIRQLNDRLHELLKGYSKATPARRNSLLLFHMMPILRVFRTRTHDLLYKSLHRKISRCLPAATP